MSKVKIRRHVIFDKTYFSQPASKATLAAQTLQHLGYYSKEDWNIDDSGKHISHNFNIQQLTTTATKPTRGTLDLIRYDLYLDSQQPIIIPPGTIMPLPTGIAIECPTGNYARIAPYSRLTVKNNLTTMAGIIFPDYCGHVTPVLLQNFGNTI
jgi:hypothetical protein